VDHTVLAIIHKLFLLVRCLLWGWACSTSPPSPFDRSC